MIVVPIIKATAICRHKVEMQPPKPPQGRLQRFWKAPVSQQQREAMDLDSCRRLFACAGWPAADFAGEGKGADEKLASVLARAQAVQSGKILSASLGKSMALPDFE